MKTIIALAFVLALPGCAVWNAPVSSDYRCQTANIGTKYARSYCTENGRVVYRQAPNYYPSKSYKRKK